MSGNAGLFRVTVGMHVRFLSKESQTPVFVVSSVTSGLCGDLCLKYHYIKPLSIIQYYVIMHANSMLS